MQTKLPYLGANAESDVLISSNGFIEIPNVKCYEGISVRDNVVVRIDLIRMLTEHFTSKSVDEYRAVLYMLIAGSWGEELRPNVQEFLMKLYQTDEVFRMKMGKLFYFRDANAEHLSLYDALICDIMNDLVNCETLAKSCVVYNKLICTSHLYVYLSVPKVDLSKNIAESPVKVEVVSKC